MQITNNLNSARTQSFSYDELNRIQTAGVPSDWGLSYAYDRYGNLLTRSVTQGSAPALSDLPPCEFNYMRCYLRSALIWEQLEKAGVRDVRGVWCHEAGGSR